MATNKPNIAIILIDSLARTPFLEALENDQLPNFKELTRKATLYKNAYSPAASTTPSIASLLSGYYSIKFGVRSVRDPIPSKMPLITDILHDIGYTSLAEVTGPLGN
ncbi:MAG: sulfatase-like hydrolase/transferase, partial [Crenarchaeota archaeon]|nr:sulfatase-like hydrolase/transferase [Thermoproteota archaeon]